MSLVEFYKPRSLSPARLDRYLASGWFRSSNGLFRNKLLCLEGKLCQVVNIRMRLEDFQPGKSQRRLLRKSRSLKVEVGPLEICNGMENLYQYTRKRFKGFIFPNLQAFLYDFHNRRVFKSMHVKVYEGKQLIAASIFDCGKDSVMSVLGIYHPAYKHLSPGILTMLQEVLWAEEQGKKFYYPGYVLKESDSFDYKLSLGTFEYLSDKNRWTPDYDKALRNSPATRINEQSYLLEKALEEANIPHQRLLYKLFSLGYAYPAGTFVRSPVIFILPELSDNPFKISMCAYDKENGSFRLCHPIPVQDNYLSENQSEEFRDHETYYDMILQDSPEDHLYFKDTEDLCSYLTLQLQKRNTRHHGVELYISKT